MNMHQNNSPFLEIKMKGCKTQSNLKNLHNLDTGNEFFSQHLLKQNLYINYRILKLFFLIIKVLAGTYKYYADTVSTMVFLMISPKFSSQSSVPPEEAELELFSLSPA